MEFLSFGLKIYKLLSCSVAMMTNDSCIILPATTTPSLQKLMSSQQVFTYARIYPVQQSSTSLCGPHCTVPNKYQLLMGSYGVTPLNVDNDKTMM